MPETDVEYRFEVEFKESHTADEPVVSFSTVVPAASYDAAREQLESELTNWTESVSADVSDCVRSTTVSFADVPWETGEERTEMIRNLDSVESARYESPLDGAYSPPKYHLKTNGDVTDEVRSLFPGFTVTQESLSRAEVVVAPTAQ